MSPFNLADQQFGLFEKWPVLKGHCPNTAFVSLDPPHRQTVTVGIFSGPIFLISDGCHDIRKENTIHSSSNKNMHQIYNSEVSERVPLFACFLTLHESKMCRGLQSARCVYLLKGQCTKYS